MDRARISLLLSGGLIAAALLQRAEVFWPWLLTLSLGTSAAGIALAFTGGPSRRVVACVLVILGWYFRIHVGGTFDAMPPVPFLARSFDLPPALGMSIGAAGLYLLSEKIAVRSARRLLIIGGLLLVSSVLLPQTQAGTVTLPLIVGLQLSPLALMLGLILLAAGSALLWVVIRSPALTPTHLRAIGVALLVAVPGWLIVRSAYLTALTTLGDGLAVAACLVLLLREEWSESTRRSAIWTAEAMALLLLASAWWLLKLQGLGYAATDEYIYFYAAKAWADGVWPYRDFFFSHPPLHLAVPMVLFKLFGFHHLLAKLIGPVAIFIAGLVLWHSARKHFGVVAGIASIALFWFASEVLKASTTFTGVELTTLFLTLGIVAALDRRAFTAGLWFGVSACTGVYGLAGFLTFGVLALAAPKQAESSRIPGDRLDAVRMAAGFALVFGAVNGLFYAFAGEAYIDGVYRYHLLKGMKNSQQLGLGDNPFALLYNGGLLLQGHEFRVELYYHAAHYWFALLALGAVIGRSVSWRPRSWWPTSPGATHPDGIVVLLFLSAAGTLTELGSMRERYDFYFTLVFPTLALLGGCFVGDLVRMTDSALTPLPAPQATKPAWRWPVAALICAALWIPLDAWADFTAFTEEITPRGASKGVGEVLRFEWVPSPVLPALGEVAHALFWQDTRVRGEIHTGIRHFLWSKKRFFEKAPEMASYIEAHTTAADSITGSSDYAPLIALLAHRRLSGNQVDTNSKVFVTGIVSEAVFWDRVCKDRPAYIVAAEMSFFAPDELKRLPIVGTYFQRETTFQDHGLKQWKTVPIELWRRKNEPPEMICEGGR